MTDIESQIYDQMVRAFGLLGAGSDLLSIVASKDDSLPDLDILQELQTWNKHYSTHEYTHVPYPDRMDYN